MPRDVPANLQTLLDNARTTSRSTLDLTYSDTSVTERHWATTAFTNGATTYTPHLKKVGEIRQSLSSSSDRVQVAVKNNDNVVCADVASALRYFNYAEAVVGRHYSADNAGITHWSEMFRGRVMSPEVTEKELRFDIVDSLVAAGLVIANRPLTIKCPFRFKDTRTCGYVGIETTCNKMVDSRYGCRGRGNKAKFGGWSWPFPNISVAPTGTGVGYGDPELPCFTAGTMISMADGTYKEIQEVRRGDWVLCFYYDEKLGCDVVTTSQVGETFEHDTFEYFEFTFEDGTTLPVTAEHPLYVAKGAFLAAEFARLKQKIAYLDRDLYGSYEMRQRRIVSMKWNNEAYFTEEPIKVYNFHVLEHQTYFANDTAVHNSKHVPF